MNFCVQLHMYMCAKLYLHSFELMCPKFIEHACLRPIQHTVHSHYLSPNWSNTGFDPTKPIVMSVCVSITYVPGMMNSFCPMFPTGPER